MTFSDSIKRIISRNSPRLRTRGRILQRLARTIGLVYFGTVDQKIDDHDVVRGLTVSTTHKDSHYAVGSYDGYDISMVDRFDVIVDHQGNASQQTWLILQIDLQRPDTLPHVFLKPLGHSVTAYDKLFRAFHQLQPINSMLLGGHSQEFRGRYELYATPSQALELETLFTPTVTQTIAARLWPHAIELFEGKLYLYTTDTTISSTLIEAGLQSALWLARVLDQDDQE